MSIQINKSQQINPSIAAANLAGDSKSIVPQFDDNRPAAIQFRKFQDMANNSSQVSQLGAIQLMINKAIQPQPSSMVPIQMMKIPPGEGYLEGEANTFHIHYYRGGFHLKLHKQFKIVDSNQFYAGKYDEALDELADFAKRQPEWAARLRNAMNDLKEAYGY